jgi:hypothetical protein
MVVTQTNEQSFDVARRFAMRYPSLETTLIASNELAVPRSLEQIFNLRVVRQEGNLPSGRCVTIANAWKWTWAQNQRSFDLQIVDEAFQLPDYRFHQIAGLAQRVVLVGDPGQIRPVITCETERWKTDPTGPHVPAPHALTERHPWVMRMALPVSRRLVPDTVAIVQPAFYPDLPFQALSAPGERALTAGPGGSDQFDRIIDLALDGMSIVGLRMPALVTGPADPEMADSIAEVICRLFERRATIVDSLAERPLMPKDGGVVCAHVVQVAAVRERLPAEWREVLIETADRFQGLERPVILVHHPLSGRADASEFHLDAGRLCVMLSRHRVACVVVYRDGITETLQKYVPAGDRVLGIAGDAEFEGWRAHSRIMGELEADNRVAIAGRIGI